MSQIGGGRMASSIVLGIKSEVAKAMDDAKKEIAGATADLVTEIKNGTQNVKRAIAAETLRVREEFGEIVGNATAEAESAVAEVRKEAEVVKPFVLPRTDDTVPNSPQHDLLKKTSNG